MFYRRSHRLWTSISSTLYTQISWKLQPQHFQWPGNFGADQWQHRPHQRFHLRQKSRSKPSPIKYWQNHNDDQNMPEVVSVGYLEQCACPRHTTWWSAPQRLELWAFLLITSISTVVSSTETTNNQRHFTAGEWMSRLNLKNLLLSKYHAYLSKFKSKPVVLGCSGFTKFCWVGKHVNIIMKPTNSPTQGQPNQRKNRLKVAFGPLSPTVFRWVEIGFI